MDGKKRHYKYVSYLPVINCSWQIVKTHLRKRECAVINLNKSGIWYISVSSRALLLWPTGKTERRRPVSRDLTQQFQANANKNVRRN